MKIRLMLLPLLIMPGSALAADYTIRGSVLSAPEDLPIAGVNIELVEPAGALSPSTISDENGNFSVTFSTPTSHNFHSPYIVFKYHKTGYHESVNYQQCDFNTSSVCKTDAIQLSKIQQPTDLSLEEQSQLAAHTNNTGNSLFLIPYRMLPDNAPSQIDQEIFAYALQSAITTRMQDLEEYLGVQAFDPLPPIELRTLEQSLSITGLAKRRSIGQYVNALAMISGISQWKNGDGEQIKMNIYSDFLVVPAEQGKNSRLLQVRDKGLSSETVNSIELADQLSPLWGHFALLAIASKEYERATKNGDNSMLERIKAYLIAEKATLSKNETFKLNDLNRLLNKIDGRLYP